ncbi:MAG: DoxX family protein [Salinibacter sp.]
MSESGRTLRRLESNRHLVLDAIRVYLGAGLFFRGLALLITDTGLQRLAGEAAPSVATTGVAVYVIAAHLVGGVLLAVGLYTRLAALVQLPILIGAVVLVHWQDGLLSANQSLEFSALVLFLLGLVALFGGGRWSLDARRGVFGTKESAGSDNAGGIP